MPDDHKEYELTVRQEPKQARICGVGADRRPIVPPPIIQLRVIDPHSRQPPSSANPDVEDTDPNYAHGFLQNYYFMFACLTKPDDDTELHWLNDGETRCTTGSVVSSLYHLKAIKNPNEDANVFVFPDLSVHSKGSYRLKFSLFEVVNTTVRHCKSIYSALFYVYTTKTFSGMDAFRSSISSLMAPFPHDPRAPTTFFPESTCADQDIKIRIRKDILIRKRPIAALAPPSDGGPPDNGETRKLNQKQTEDDPHAQQPPSLSSQPTSRNATSGSAVVKRARHGTLPGPLHHLPGPASVASATQGGIEFLVTSALPHTQPHTQTTQTMDGGVGIGVGGQLLSVRGEPSNSGSASVSVAARRTGPQTLSSLVLSYPSSLSSVDGMFDRVNNDYEPASLQGTMSSYDPQRPLGATGYESASGGGGRGGYDTSARSGYESGARGGRGFEHAHQHCPCRSYDSRRGYESSDVGADTNPNVNPNVNPNANGPGTGGSGGYYDNSPSSSSPHPHSHVYCTSGTSGQAQLQPSQIAPHPPWTHTKSYASSGSGGSPYKYGQLEGHGSSSSTEYYTQGHGYGHPGLVVSPEPNSGYAHGLGQQEIIHLAPLRHASGSVGGGGASTTSSSSFPSSPALPSVSVSREYPMIQLSRAPFEQDRQGGEGKRAMLSIVNIISDGV